MIIPSELVKCLGIDPLSIFLLLKVKGKDNLQLNILREEDLEKKESENMTPVNKSLPDRSQQVSPSTTGVE